MKKYGKLYKIITIVVFLAIGCIFTIGHFRHKDYSDMVEKHKATKLQQDGVWDMRFSQNSIDPATDDVDFCVSINVKKDMTHEDMLDIMDYYEMIENASFVGYSYEGERENNVYTCYAVFYRGDTEEEICRIKYRNGEETQDMEEYDEYKFPTPDKRTEVEDDSDDVSEQDG